MHLPGHDEFQPCVGLKIIMGVTTLNPQGSRNAPNVIRSVTGMSRNAHIGPDIQVAAAVLQRVGLGAWLATGSGPTTLIYPTGPIAWSIGFNPLNVLSPVPNSTVDPLYLKCVIKIVWGDPGASTATYEIDYDLVNQDMTTVLTDFLGGTTTNTNIAPGYAQTVDFTTNPGSPPTGFSYSTAGGGTFTPSLSGTSATIIYSGYTEPLPSGIVHYGATLFFTLSNQKNYTDYADACVANILDTLTVGNNITVFSGAQLYPGESQFSWLWIKGFPKISSPLAFNYTNSVAAYISRANGVQVKRMTEIANLIVHGGGGTAGATNRVRFVSDTFLGNAFLPSLTTPAYKTVLAGYGMPFVNAPAAGVSVVLDSDLSFQELSTQVVPWILCVKSCVRNNTAMGNDYKFVSYDPSTNASGITWSTPAGLPSSPSQTEFDPPASVGCYSCPYINAASIAPLQWGFNNNPDFEPPNSAGTVFPVTVYAMTQDVWGNTIETVSATWSLINITGSVVAGDLVPSADGRSAIYSGAHHGSCQIQCVAGGLTGVSLVLTT